MALLANQIRDLVLASLSVEERRLLTLTVAVRKALEAQPIRASPIRGDLSQTIKLCLRRLVLAGQVTDKDGVFSLTSTTRATLRSPAIAQTA